MKRRVCVVTGSRAEYGLLKWLLRDLAAAESVELQLIVTGAHLAPEFGLTYQEIEADGFRIDRKLESLLSSDTAVGAAKSIGLGVIGFADAFARDCRRISWSFLAIVMSCLPPFRLHLSREFRLRMSMAVKRPQVQSMMLYATLSPNSPISTSWQPKSTASRVIQLGEHPDRVRVVGGLGVDAISRIRLLDRQALSKAIGFEFGNRNLLVTFHPETLSDKSPEVQVNAMLKALDGFPDVNLIITYPNADVGGQAIADLLEAYAMQRRGAKVFRSLGQLNYLSCLQFVDGVVGNSSSGLLEVPTFRKGTVNIGLRQSGRPRAASVIDCDAEEAEISAALTRLFSDQFQSTLTHVENPYGNGGASRQIAAILESVDLGLLSHKPFYDMNAESGGGVVVSSTSSAANWREALLQEQCTVEDAIRRLNDAALQIVIVVDRDGGLLVRSLTGISGAGCYAVCLSEARSIPSSYVLRLVVPPEMRGDLVAQLMRANRIHQIPVVDENRHVVGTASLGRDWGCSGAIKPDGDHGRRARYPPASPYRKLPQTAVARGRQAHARTHHRAGEG
jgi:GDP/UDP-N,N'-diacetylbacillosamine 2-epimerase (hydrolysing)